MFLFMIAMLLNKKTTSVKSYVVDPTEEGGWKLRKIIFMDEG